MPPAGNQWEFQLRLTAKKPGFVVDERGSIRSRTPVNQIVSIIVSCCRKVRIRLTTVFPWSVVMEVSFTPCCHPLAALMPRISFGCASHATWSVKEYVQMEERVRRMICSVARPARIVYSPFSVPSVADSTRVQDQRYTVVYDFLIHVA